MGFRGGVTGLYGDRTALIAQLEVTYADGSTGLIVTDGSWRCAAGPVTAASLYDGEHFDARLAPHGWSLPGFDDAAWLPAEALDLDAGRLVAPTGPPVRRIETLRPTAVLTGPGGETILDFGQNVSGRLRIRVSGPAGHTVSLRHAEVLEDGAPATRPLRGDAALDRYTLDGSGEEEWEPRFTVHGFRYAQVSDWPGPLPPDAVEAVVVHTDLRPTGSFECSDPLLTRLHENIRWSMRGNFVDLPTDLPQRDERLGWTGDIQVFTPTAAFLHDCAGTLGSWLADLAAEQSRLGTVPPYVPWVELIMPALPAAAWGDAAVIVPWLLYERFGDRGLLERQYPSMRAWCDEVAYRLLTQTECPSWLYPVTMGATTVWERWDSMLPDGSVNPGDMTSFNHYALGAVADFLHRRVAGLAPAAPGYRRLRVAPRPGGSLTSASAALDTPYGRAAVAWSRTDDFNLTLVVPPGTTGTLEVAAGTHTFTAPL